MRLLLFVAAAEYGCWQGDFTYERCCNVIHGPGGLSTCWSEQFTYAECCRNGTYVPYTCDEVIATFDYSVIQLAPSMMPNWDMCTKHMATQPEACGLLSPHLVRYIKCVQAAQAVDSKPRRVQVQGVHHPTVIAATAKHTFVAAAYDAYVGNRLIQDGGWMLHEVRLVEALLPPGGTFIDAGANIGGFTVPIARHVGESGRVLAFEPFRTLFQLLTANVAINGLGNVWTHNVGLSNETTTVEARIPDLKQVANPSKMHIAAEVASDMLVPYGAMEEMYVRTLDSFTLNLDRVDFIKIDVESMELAMLHGAARTLIRHGPLVFVEDSEIDNFANLREPTAVMSFLYSLQYMCINLEQSGLPGMTSLLCCPQHQKDIVQRRLNLVHSF